METMPHILVIDDDREIRDLLARFLERNRFRVTAVRDGREARRAWPNGNYQLVVLDLMLPGEGGLEVARWLRSQGDIPIVMLTAMGEETDRIVGLELGADDYVPKPFNPRELLARVRAVMRRARPGAVNERLTVGALDIDVPGHRVTVEGKEVPLTSFELRLLVVLARRAGETVPREDLASALKVPGGYDPSVDRSLDVHVSHLR